MDSTGSQTTSRPARTAPSAGPAARLAAHVAAAAVVAMAIVAPEPAQAPVARWLTVAAATIALAWAGNLYNFMDGIDWMTVAETVPSWPIVTALAPSGMVMAGCTA